MATTSCQAKITKQENLIYSTTVGDSELFVSPYPPDKLLAQAYIRMEDEGLLDTLFHERVPTLSEFLLRFCVERQAILACSIKENGVQRLAGFGWFNQSQRIGHLDLVRCEAGIIFFKDCRKLRITTTFGHLMTAWAFSNIKPKGLTLDVIFGTTPQPNRAACMYFRRLGWKSIGPLPNYTTYPGFDGPVAVYISFMTRSGWIKASPFV